MLELANKIGGSIVLTVTGALIISRLLDKRINIWSFRSLSILLTLSFSTIIVYKIHYDFSITLIIFIFATYTYSKLFKISIDKSIVVSFLVIFLLCIAEIILTVLLVSILGIDITYLRDVNNFIFILINILVCIMAFAILKIKSLEKLMKELVILINEQKMPLIILFCLMEVIVIGLILSKIGLNFIITYNFFINLLLITFFLLIFFMFVMEKLRYQKLTNEYSYLLNYVKTIEDWMEKERIKNHENKNQFIVIKSMIPKQNKKLINYINEIFNETVVLENNWVSKLQNIPKGGLRGLLYYKIAQINNDNIELYLDISKNLKTNYISKINTHDYRDLCTVLGVYLDNAIEAARISEKKQISIEIYPNKKEITIVISNTFIGKLNIEKFYKSGYSTKGIRRGYGLPLVKSILEKNHRLSQSRAIVNNYYVQYLNIQIDDN